MKINPVLQQFIAIKYIFLINMNYLYIKTKENIFFFKLRFTPCKAEHPLQGMELQEKETRKD